MVQSVHQLALIGASALFAFTATACAQDQEASNTQVMVAGLARDMDRAMESIPGVVSHYGMVETRDGARLRTIITQPENTATKLHPIIFTQWVSCGSIEYQDGGSRGILGKLATQSGLSLLRVERSTSGDSQGPACNELDYDTEIAHYVEAYETLLEDERLDSSKVYVYGSSLGSTTAPLVALALQEKGYNIAAIAIQGGGAETYLERMLTFDRLYLERRPEEVSPADIHDEMIRRAKFHYEYLINDRDPDEIASDNADMAAARAGIRGMDDDAHYGRPYAWHQQAAKHNFLAAWAAINASVLVIYNEFDQFEAQFGHQVIADMVNRLRPGTATFVVQENMGHSNYYYATVEDAYAGRDGEPKWEQTADVILNWLHQQQ